VVEAGLVHLRIQEPAEQQVVVELLAKQPLAAHRVQRHQQRGFQQPLGRQRRSPHRAVHLIEHRRKFLERSLGQGFDAPQRMVLRDPLLRIDHHQHRPLPLIFTAHPPLPPPLRLLIWTNFTRMKFRLLSTVC
jgi:hypothetical protein